MVISLSPSGQERGSSVNSKTSSGGSSERFFEDAAFVTDVPDVGILAVDFFRGRGHGNISSIGVCNRFRRASECPIPAMER